MELNKIYCGDSRNMYQIDSNSIALTMTSPPYSLFKDFDLDSLDKYFQLLYDVFNEVVRVTIPGCKIAVNLGDICIGSRYNEDSHVEEILIMPKLVDFLRTKDVYLYARYFWIKDVPWKNSSQVSFHSKVLHSSYRAAPSVEYVFVFRKGKSERKDKSFEDGRWISKNEWKKLVSGYWFIPSVRRNDIHPAIYPESLVSNVIKLYSFPQDTVLDPFSGVATTAVVAKKLSRNFLGYEIDKNYHKKGNDRLAAITDDMIEKPKPYFDKTQNKKELEGDVFKGGGGIIE